MTHGQNPSFNWWQSWGSEKINILTLRFQVTWGLSLQANLYHWNRTGVFKTGSLCYCYFSCLIISFVPVFFCSLKITVTETCSRRSRVVGLRSQNGLGCQWLPSVKKAAPGSLSPGNPYPFWSQRDLEPLGLWGREGWHELEKLGCSEDGIGVEWGRGKGRIERKGWLGMSQRRPQAQSSNTCAKAPEIQPRFNFCPDCGFDLPRECVPNGLVWNYPVRTNELVCLLGPLHRPCPLPFWERGNLHHTLALPPKEGDLKQSVLVSSFCW